MNEVTLAAFIKQKFSEQVTVDQQKHEKKLTDIFKLEFLFTLYQTQIQNANTIADDVIE